MFCGIETPKVLLGTKVRDSYVKNWVEFYGEIRWQIRNEIYSMIEEVTEARKEFFF